MLMSPRNAQRTKELALHLRMPDGKAPVQAELNGERLPAAAMDGDVVLLPNPAETISLKVQY
jgi:hypothetical protein